MTPKKHGFSLRVTAFCMALLFLFSQFPFFAFAEEELLREGIVIGSDVRVRSGPGTSFAALVHNGSEIRLFAGYSVTIHGDAVPEKNAADEPTTGEDNEPTTGENNEPTTGENNEPTTGEVTEPTTGEVTEPTTGENSEPTTGEVTEPTTGEVTEPTTGENNEPTTGEGTEPTTGEKDRKSVV